MVWNAQTGHELLTLKGHVGGVLSIAFSPNGTRVATGSSDDSIKLWDSQTGQELLTLQSKSPTNLTFSPDGHRLLVSSADRITTYDATPLPEKP